MHYIFKWQSGESILQLTLLAFLRINQRKKQNGNLIIHLQGVNLNGQQTEVTHFVKILMWKLVHLISDVTVVMRVQNSYF